jgi:hypothetical protein
MSGGALDVVIVSYRSRELLGACLEALRANPPSVPISTVQLARGALQRGGAVPLSTTIVSKSSTAVASERSISMASEGVTVGTITVAVGVLRRRRCRGSR